MNNRKNLIALVAATTCVTAGIAYAADQAMQASSAQSAVTKDVGKLSSDSSKAYVDVALTRLAIFDGRIDDAKKYVEEADSEFDKAKSDESVFLKAESDLKTADQLKQGAPGAKAGASTGAATQTGGADTTPKRWLPVDAAMSVSEDYTANPQKAAAVSQANKKLAAGDKKGALETLKLADVNLDYVMAVVPLDQTLKDVHEAATDVNGGKYYEASQVLRQIEASTRYDLLDVDGVLGKAPPAKPATDAH